MESTDLKYMIGQVIHHTRFDYRGVIIDADPIFRMSDDWYIRFARSKPPRDQPWYRVLVHDSDQITYVAERHLEPDASGRPVEHPMLNDFFNEFREGCYLDTRSVN